MYKQYAVELFDQYMREHSDARDLDPEQIEVVIDKLIHKRYDHTPANIDDVASVIEQEFPKEKNMFRPGYKPQSTQQTQQSQQSPQEQKQILAAFLTNNYAARVAPNAIQLVDPNGKVVSRSTCKPLATPWVKTRHFNYL